MARRWWNRQRVSVDQKQAKLPPHKARGVGNDVYGEERLELAKLVKPVLNRVGVTWFLDGGTLLGAYRSGEVLPRDDDFDTAVYMPGYSGTSDLTGLEDELRGALGPRYAVRLVTSYAHKLEVYDPKSSAFSLPGDGYLGADFHTVTVDIQLMTDGPEQTVVYRHDMLDDVFVPKRCIEPTGQIECDGVLFNCPHDIVGFLEAQYGYLGADAEYDPVSKRYVKVG